MDFEFWKKCERDANNCWNWIGHITAHGYGRYSFAGKSHAAHRYSVEQFKPIEDGFCIDHLCRNKKCVNPDHLDIVTPRENTRRHWATVTHFVNGHEFTPENTKFYNLKHRAYRTCVTCHDRQKKIDRERARSRAPRPKRLTLRKKIELAIRNGTGTRITLEEAHELLSMLAASRSTGAADVGEDNG